MAAEARATKKNISGSPRKMRLVLDLIRGKQVPQALSVLHFTPNHATIVAEKTLRSAIANFQQNPTNSRVNVEDLVVRACWADGGPMLKRVLPAPMGRAYRVRKRSNHLTIVVGEAPVENVEEKKRTPKTKAAKAAPAAEAAPAVDKAAGKAADKAAAPKARRTRKAATAK